MNARLLFIGSVWLLASGCGFVFAKGPPTGHQQMESFTCNESDAAPILDVVWASLNVLGAVAALSDRDNYDHPDQVIAVGLGWGVFSSFSASHGFDKSKQCRRALAQLAERQAQRHGNVGAVPVQAVVITPADDTLGVGERVQLVAAAHSSSGEVVANRTFMWSSSNDAIASVSNAGLVTANAPGSVVIAANTSNVVGIARILVSGPR
jgi:uncharacterized protein YjdB